MKAQAQQEIRYEGVYCDLTVQSFPPRVVVLVLSGTDIGEFGDAPFQALERYFSTSEQVELFVDARHVRAASINVSGEWARWLFTRKIHLQHVSMLTASRFVQMTAEFVRRFADLGCLMRIYTDPASFDSALTNSIEKQ